MKVVFCTVISLVCIILSISPIFRLLCILYPGYDTECIQDYLVNNYQTCNGTVMSVLEAEYMHHNICRDQLHDDLRYETFVVLDNHVRFNRISDCYSVDELTYDINKKCISAVRHAGAFLGREC